MTTYDSDIPYKDLKDLLTMNKFEKLNKEFLRKGYLIQKVENKEALKYMNSLIKNKLSNLIRTSLPQKKFH